MPETGPEGEALYEVANTPQALREMLKVDQDWKLESFHNHAHFSLREGEEACLRYQYRDVRETSAILLERFPHRRFVLTMSPLDRNTVYQVAEGAPTDDNEAWKPNGPLSGFVLGRMLEAPGADPERTRAEAFEAFRERRCERCNEVWRYETDAERPEFPGARWAICPKCDLPNVVAVKTLRWVVPPPPVLRV